MDNQEILDMLQNKANDIPVPDSLQPDQIEKMLEDKKQNRLFFTKKVKTAIAMAASFAVICAAGLGLHSSLSRYRTGDIEETNIASLVVETVPTGDLKKNNTTYTEICDAINRYNEEIEKEKETTKYGSSGSFLDGLFSFGQDTAKSSGAGEYTDQAEYEDEMPVGSSNGTTESSASSDSDDYSDTDTQVDGIMEGDIVKTDGRHIFTIDENTGGYTVTIYNVDGANVEQISQFAVSQADCREMYIEGNTLVMVGDLWNDDVPAKDETDFDYYYAPMRTSHITLYDISNPAEPKAIRQLSQSGDYNTSRISNGYLYTFSNYTIAYDKQYKEDEPENFVPKINGTAMKADCIHLLNQNGANSYMVMTSLKLSDNAGFADSQSVLGAFDTYYMNQNHIYAVNKNYEDYSDYSSIRSTIVKYSYDNGSFDFQGNTKIRGEINNSYYMHEYKDHFVFVYTREKDDRTVNGLCVMDENLKVTGEISELGINERIYASYFIDNMAYFVTYRNTDPVFAVDISDPAKPELKSELKLPGFSSYLHSFGSDMLIGIGYGSNNRGIETLNNDTVKLSLFSIGKNYEIKEIDKHLEDPNMISYSDENHKAVFVDEERMLVGYGIEKDYLKNKSFYVVYKYKKGKMKKVLSVPLGNGIYAEYVRGLRIGEYFYIVDTKGGIEVYDINTWKKAK